MLAQGQNVAMARPLNCLMNKIVKLWLMTNTPAAYPEFRVCGTNVFNRPADKARFQCSGQPTIAKPFYVIEMYVTVNDWKFWHFCFLGVLTTCRIGD